MRSSQAAMHAFVQLVSNRSKGVQLPQDVLRMIGRYVGFLPTVDEALDLSKHELRACLIQHSREKVSILKRYSTSTLVTRLLLLQLYPDLEEKARQALYRDALRRRERRLELQNIHKAKISTLRKELSRCPKGRVGRIADLRQELLLLQQQGTALSNVCTYSV